jgi:hypothetical protein
LATVALATAFGMRSFITQTAPTVIHESQPTTVSSIAKDESPFTIIISSPNRNDCRRYQLNKTTGMMNDKRTSDCTGEAGGQGARIEEISEAFRNR